MRMKNGNFKRKKKKKRTTNESIKCIQIQFTQVNSSLIPTILALSFIKLLNAMIYFEFMQFFISSC